MKKVMLLTMMLSSVSVQVLPSDSGDAGLTAVVLFGLVYTTYQSYVFGTGTNNSVSNFSQHGKQAAQKDQAEDQKSSGRKTPVVQAFAVPESYDEKTITLHDLATFAQTSPVPEKRTSPIQKGAVSHTDTNSLPPILKYPLTPSDTRLGGPYVGVSLEDVPNYGGGTSATVGSRFDTNQSKGIQPAAVGIYDAATKKMIITEEFPK